MGRYKKILFYCGILNLINSVANAQWVSIQDSLTLVELYDSTDGSSWKDNTNWKTTEPVASWHGVTVNNNRVIALKFTGNNMKGQIPASFGNLNGLTNLFLLDNGLKANPFSFLGSLTSLVNLHIGEFMFTDSIPESVSNLVNLTEFTLYGSYNLNSLPNSLKSLDNLLTIDVQGNGLRGDISRSVPSNVKGLDISANQLTFTGIEKLANDYPEGTLEFYYSPQANIPITQIDDKLIVSAGGSLANNTYKWYKEGSGLVDSITGDSVFRPSSAGSYYAEVSNSVATSLQLVSNKCQALSSVIKTCPEAANAIISAEVLGTSFQWQVSLDSVNYSNITNDDHYLGVTTSSLSINNIPTGWYGRRFRCIVDDNPSIFFTIIFNNNWTGTGSTDWESTSNWSCGSLPDANTDVTIKSGSVVLNTDVEIRSLKLLPGASLLVQPGYTLIIKNK
jgi:hypothetical protein